MFPAIKVRTICSQSMPKYAKAQGKGGLRLALWLGVAANAKIFPLCNDAIAQCKTGLALGCV